MCVCECNTSQWWRKVGREQRGRGCLINMYKKKWDCKCKQQTLTAHYIFTCYDLCLFWAEQGLVTKRECIKERNSACGVLDSFYCQAFDQDSGCTLAEMHTHCTPGQRTKAPGGGNTPVVIFISPWVFVLLGFKYFQCVFLGTNTTDTVCEDCETGFYSQNGIECTKWTM